MKSIIMLLASAIILTSCAVEKSNCCAKKPLRTGKAKVYVSAKSFNKKHYNNLIKHN
jgi:hypothetical protein